jgi:hypothetical protein
MGQLGRYPRRVNAAARLRSLPSLRGALATKQSIFPCCVTMDCFAIARNDGAGHRPRFAMTALGCLKMESE